MSVICEIISPKSDLDDEVEVKNLYFSNNDEVNENDELLEIETSKTAIAIESTSDGFVEFKTKVGDYIKVGSVVALIHDSPFDDKSDSSEEIKINKGNRVISAAAESYINENNIDISNIDKKFITLKDLFQKKSIEKSLTSISNEKIQTSSLETVSKPISKLKKAEIRALSNVNSSGLVSTLSVNVDAVKIKNDSSMLANTNNTYLPIIINEVSKLLVNYPELNSYFNDDKVNQYVDINIGIALDIDDGLKIYNIRNCNNLSLDEIKDSISEGVYSYLRKTLTIENITESTFTITDLSQYGVSHFIPLINNMQSAILGVSAIDNALNRFTLTLSIDHRVTEGKVAAKFLTELSDRINKQSS